MRNTFAKSLICLLCVAASANAGKKAPLYLVPAYGPPITGHVLRLHQELLNAAESGDIPEVKKLLAMGANINVIENYSKSHTPLTYAAEGGNVAMTRFLLAHGADANGCGVKLSPLFWAVSNGETDCVRILLQRGADPYRNCVDYSRPIDFAAQDGQIEIVRMLIGRMPRLSRDEAHQRMTQASNILLSKVVNDGPLDVIKESVKFGANVNNLDANDDYGVGSPLMRATSRGSLPIMRFLLAHGAQVNLQDSDGRTALMYTGETDMYYGQVIPNSGKPKVVHNAATTLLLLQHGAKVAPTDKIGMTALMYAAQGNPQATALLLAHGARINKRDANGRTALHWAATLRDAKSLEILLRHGAQVNAQDAQGATALMLASVNPDAQTTTNERAQVRALAVLKRFGANPRLKDKEGKTSSAYSKMEDSDFVTAG